MTERRGKQYQVMGEREEEMKMEHKFAVCMQKMCNDVLSGARMILTKDLWNQRPNKQPYLSPPRPDQLNTWNKCLYLLNKIVVLDVIPVPVVINKFIYLFNNNSQNGCKADEVTF